MSFFSAIISAVSAKHRKIVNAEAKGTSLTPNSEFTNLFIKMNAGHVVYSDNMIKIQDSDFNELRKAPFTKKLDNGWIVYEDPRGFCVEISSMGERGIITFFNFHTKKAEFKISFSMTE